MAGKCGNGRRRPCKRSEAPLACVARTLLSAALAFAFAFAFAFGFAFGIAFGFAFDFDLLLTPAFGWSSASALHCRPKPTFPKAERGSASVACFRDRSRFAFPFWEFPETEMDRQLTNAIAKSWYRPLFVPDTPEVPCALISYTAPIHAPSLVR